MDITAPLTSFIGDLLTRFSDRCVELLVGHSAGDRPLSITRELLSENIAKEVVKDRTVIEKAVSSHRAGAPLTDRDIDDLWERSQQVDRDFVQHMVMPSVSIRLRFEDIREIRKKRFRFLAGTVQDLLQVTEDGGSLDDAIRSLYSAEQYHGMVSELLFLYSVEVKMLARSVQFLPPFNRAMDMFVDEVVEAMETVRRDVAATETARLFPVAPARSRRSIFA